jgi:protoporphyrinogen oxidase
MPSFRCRTLIVGAGLTGLSAAYHLEKLGETNYILIESSDGPGGWARTDWYGEYGVDRAVKALYFRHEEFKQLIGQLLCWNWLEHRKNCLVDSAGVRTPFPFHANLYGRSPEIVEECLSGMRAAAVARKESLVSPMTFADWIELHYGAGVARHFMYPYNEKMWTVPPKDMTCDWMSDLVPTIDLSRVYEGAKRPLDSQIGLNARFYYPRRGISEMSEALAACLQPIRYNTGLCGISPSEKLAILSDGSEVRYSHLISTIPLKDLGRLIKPMPHREKIACDCLEALDLMVIDLGFKDPEVNDVHWVYLPDIDILPYRLQLCHAFSSDIVPPGHGLYCIEIAYSSHRPLSGLDLRSRVISDLINTGWLESATQVCFYRERRFRNAYILPRIQFKDDAATVRNYLSKWNIDSIGRYGEWKYANMEDSLIDGKRAALSVTSSSQLMS